MKPSWRSQSSVEVHRFEGASWGLEVRFEGVPPLGDNFNVAAYEVADSPSTVAINGWTAAFVTTMNGVTLVQFAPTP